MAAASFPPLQLDEECSVCKEVFRGQETVRLHCGHSFHSLCGQQWYKTQRPCSCPLCRQKFDTVCHYDATGAIQEESPEWVKIKAEAHESDQRRTGFERALG